MKNFQDFVCHGCLKKYKYSGDYKNLVNRKCKHCGFIVWTQEEQDLVEKLEQCKNPLDAPRMISALPPLERRLFQYWNFVALAVGNIESDNEDIMENLE